MPFDPTHHHRRSIRLAGYDYTQAGAYFVTICTYKRQGVLGVLHDAVPTLSHIGQIVADYWCRLPHHFPGIDLDAWVIMPDHMHGIIVLRDGYSAVDDEANIESHLAQRPNGTRSGSLNAIIQNFKSISTRKVNQACQASGTHLWQRDYYESVIRDERHLHAVRRYIEANPVRARATTGNRQ